MNILDAYIMEIPSDQNILDLFDGEWSSQLPVEAGLKTNPGRSRLFDDDRVHWAEKVFGSFSGMNVCELGPLEAGHSFMLQKKGANVVSIEANSRAFLKCLCIKEIFGLDNVKVLLGDFVGYLSTTETKFDAIFASGVLYHMMDPVQLLRLISRRSDRVFLWTHYYDEDVVQAKFPGKFSAIQSKDHGGFVCEFSEQSYAKALDWQGFCGGAIPNSVWLTRQSLFRALEYCNFKILATDFDDADHPNGPAIAICAEK